MSPELVIFDCDGVLIDSEAIACRADAACLAEIGVVLSVEEILDRYLGISAAEMCADIEARHRVRLPEDFGETMRRRVATAFETELLPMAGVAEALAAMPQRRCVASSSAPQRLRHSLSLTGLLHMVRTARIQRHPGGAPGKPAPDLFLFAAASMQAHRQHAW